MNCKEQAKEIYKLCVTQANAKKDPLTYGYVLNELGYDKGVSGQAIRYGLELVLIVCASRGLPILTSIVVNQSTGRPSPSGYSEKSWQEDCQKVFSRRIWPNVNEIDWEYVWENREQLSDKYGTPEYWNHKNRVVGK